MYNLINIEYKESWKIFDTVSEEWLNVNYIVLRKLIEDNCGELETKTQKYYIFTTPNGQEFEYPQGDEIEVNLQFDVNDNKKIYNLKPLEDKKGVDFKSMEKFSAWINTINSSGMEKLVYGKVIRKTTKEREIEESEYYKALIKEQLEEANKWWTNLSDEEKITYYMNNKGGKL